MSSILTNLVADIRQACAIHSKQAGCLMIIPREDKFVRFYVQLQNRIEESQFQRSSISLDTILKAAQQILQPYNLAFERCSWFSVYTVSESNKAECSADSFRLDSASPHSLAATSIGRSFQADQNWLADTNTVKDFSCR